MKILFSSQQTKESYFYSTTISVQSLSRVRLFETPWAAARQASLSITNSWSSPKLMPIESVMPSNHLILCRPLLLPPSILPSIRVFSSESALRIRWPECWSFSFSFSFRVTQPSNRPCTVEPLLGGPQEQACVPGSFPCKAQQFFYVPGSSPPSTVPAWVGNSVSTA